MIDTNAKEPTASVINEALKNQVAIIKHTLDQKGTNIHIVLLRGFTSAAHWLRGDRLLGVSALPLGILTSDKTVSTKKTPPNPPNRNNRNNRNFPVAVGNPHLRYNRIGPVAFLGLETAED